MINKTSTKGFSLIEMMISLTLSLSFLAVAASMMVRNKQDYVPLRDSARIVEGAAASLDIINKDLQRAGFFGENTAFSYGKGSSSNFTNRIFELANGNTKFRLYGLTREVSPAGLMQSTAIEGYEGDSPGDGFLPSGTMVFDADNGGAALDNAATGILAGTDAITIRGSRGGRVGIQEVVGGPIMQMGPGVMLAQDMPNTSSDLQLQDAADFPAKGYFVVYDSISSELFKGKRTGNRIQINPAETQPVGGVANNEFMKQYESSVDGSIAGDGGQTYVTVANFSRYYIANDNSSGEAVPSLYREYYSEEKDKVIRESQVLIEGVENMQITYGEDTSAGINFGIDEYVNADEVQDWKNVRAVKIGILMRSETESSIDATSGNQDYNVNGTVVQVRTNDRYFRKVFTTQLALDNGV
jgi:type IV pilus assembly protein PilW